MRRHAREHGRRELHRGPVGTFGLHDLELSTGERFELELLRHPGASAVVPFLDAEHILLIRQYRFAVDDVIWEVPAGKTRARGSARGLRGTRTGRRDGLSGGAPRTRGRDHHDPGLQR